MESIKLSSEELEKLKTYEARYVTTTSKLGQVKVEQLVVEQELKRLNTLEEQFKNEYLSIQSEEEIFAQEITKKYGNGYINVESGEFVKQTTV